MKYYLLSPLHSASYEGIICSDIDALFDYDIALKQFNEYYYPNGLDDLAVVRIEKIPTNNVKIIEAIRVPSKYKFFNPKELRELVKDKLGYMSSMPQYILYRKGYPRGIIRHAHLAFLESYCKQINEALNKPKKKQVIYYEYESVLPSLTRKLKGLPVIPREALEDLIIL